MLVLLGIAFLVGLITRPSGSRQLGRFSRHAFVAGRAARLRLRFQARDVFLALGGAGRVQEWGDLGLGRPRLYTVARSPKLTRGLLELRLGTGVAGYAFTFG